jgi:hypothetical protein
MSMDNVRIVFTDNVSRSAFTTVVLTPTSLLARVVSVTVAPSRAGTLKRWGNDHHCLPPQGTHPSLE